MRVKISYTVDLKEVPEKIRAIVDEGVETAIAQLEKTNHAFTADLLEKGNVQSSIENLHSLREALFKTDQQLADCCELLNNLQKAYAAVNDGVDDEVGDEQG